MASNLAVLQKVSRLPLWLEYLKNRQESFLKTTLGLKVLNTHQEKYPHRDLLIRCNLKKMS
jgi:hypothetical protein